MIRVDKTKKNLTKLDVLAEEVRKKLTSTSPYFYLNGNLTEGGEADTVKFTIKSDGETPVKFSDLDQLSAAFKTKKMNIRSERESGGYCSSCAYTDVVCLIDVIDATV